MDCQFHNIIGVHQSKYCVLLNNYLKLDLLMYKLNLIHCCEKKNSDRKYITYSFDYNSRLSYFTHTNKI